MAIESGQTLLHYKIVDKLGEGGMGVVWRAVDTTLDREVAIKLLPQMFAADPDRLARFDREAKLLASLNHPNIAAVYGLHETETADGPLRLIAMELVPGEDLEQRLQRGPLPVDEALNIAAQIADGLSAAHEAGVIHRDLKPANVKLTPEGKVKVLDFGLAKAFDPVGTESNAPLSHSPTVTSAGTMVGMIMGTAAYMSPEQARGRPTDRRTDIWAFGALLFEMLTGQKPFPGEVVSDIIAKILERRPQWDLLSSPMHPGIRRLLERCMTKDPDARLRDAADIRLELQELLQDPTGRKLAADASPAESSGPRWLRVVPWLILLAMVGWVVVSPMLREDAPPEETVHFKMSPPEGHRFLEFDTAEDGSAVVFVAADGEGKRTLWVRHLDSAEPQLLPETEGASFPFWSPDAHSVAFFQGGKLRRIDVQSGSVQTIAEAPNGRGGSWSYDDTILFTPEGADLLYAIPASGGTPAAKTTFRGSEETHRFPNFIGKSRKFIYSAHDNDSSTLLRRYLASLDSDETVRLPDGMSETNTPPGYALTVREQTLVAQRFDASSGELSGNPFPLANGVSDVFSRTGSAAFSASDNGVLTFLQDQNLDSQVVSYDRSGRIIGPVSPVEKYASPSLSPDRRHFAFMRVEGKEYHLWIFDLARGAATRLPSKTTYETRAAWSADSQSIYFGSEGTIIRLAVDGSEHEVILDSSNYPPERARSLSSVRPGGESADGSFLAIAAWDPVTDFNIWMLRLDGDRELISVTEARGSQGRPNVSPDSRWIAYDSDESGRFEVYVASAKEPGRRWLISADGGLSPFWSEDGSELYYVSSDYGIMAVSVDLGAAEFNAGLPERLFDGPLSVTVKGDFFYRQPWLAGVDGNRFLFHVPDGLVRDNTINVVLNWEQWLER